jgi:hypothetical protein
MNKNVTITVLVSIIVTGVILYTIKENMGVSTTATSTSAVAQKTSNTNEKTATDTVTPTVNQAGAPSASIGSTIATSDTTAIVSGTVRPNGAFTSYWYEYGKTSDLGNKTSSQILGSGFALIQAPGYITNLSANTTYYFRIVAENQYGKTTGIQYTFKTTQGNPPPVGSIPTVSTLSATYITRTTADISGNVTPNQAATLYWFEYGKTPQLGNTSAITSAGDGGTKVTVQSMLLNLEPLTTYYFKINAQNQFGTVNGSTHNFKTAGPANQTVPEVANQEITNLSATAATFHGTVNPNGLETTYWFEYSTDSFSVSTSALVKTTSKAKLNAGKDTSSVTANIGRLTKNTTYYYRLVAQNNLGIVHSGTLIFTTK